MPRAAGEAHEATLAKGTRPAEPRSQLRGCAPEGKDQGATGMRCDARPRRSGGIFFEDKCDCDTFQVSLFQSMERSFFSRIVTNEIFQKSFSRIQKGVMCMKVCLDAFLNFQGR